MMVCVGLDLFFVSSLRALKKTKADTDRIFCNFFDWEWRDVEYEKREKSKQGLVNKWFESLHSSTEGVIDVKK